MKDFPTQKSGFQRHRNEWYSLFLRKKNTIFSLCLWQKMLKQPSSENSQMTRCSAYYIILRLLAKWTWIFCTKASHVLNGGPSGRNPYLKNLFCLKKKTMGQI